MKSKQNALEEIYRTEHGVVYQCNHRNCLHIEFAGGTSSFKVQDFFSLKKSVEAIDIKEMAINATRAADIAVIMPLHSERCFVLTLTEVLDFRELLQGAKAMLVLNSLVYECLHGMLV